MDCDQTGVSDGFRVGKCLTVSAPYNRLLISRSLVRSQPGSPSRRKRRKTCRYFAGAESTRSRHRATARHPSPDTGLRQPDPLALYWRGKGCFAEEATMRTTVLVLLALV